jgi:hypothetical protein
MYVETDDDAYMHLGGAGGVFTPPEKLTRHPSLSLSQIRPKGGFSQKKEKKFWQDPVFCLRPDSEAVAEGLRRHIFLCGTPF